MNEQLNESQNRFLDLFRNSAKEDINNKEFIKNVVISKSGRISYSINDGKSDVWRHFQQILFENNETHFVKCNKCEELFKLLLDPEKVDQMLFIRSNFDVN